MSIGKFALGGATIAAGALMLAGCATPQSKIVEGSSLAVMWDQPFTSYNDATSFGDGTANTNIVSLTNSGFWYYDDQPALVRDTSFGTYELLDEDPPVVRYTIADGVVWSDGTAVDAADLLLNWVALSGAYNTPTFDSSEYRDPDTGAFTDAFPADVIYFDSGADSETRQGLGLVSGLPEISDDRKSITLTYDAPFADWELALQNAGLPAHVVGKNALGIEDNQAAKDAIIAAISDKDEDALAALARFWNSGFDFVDMPDDPDLVVSNGPYTISEFVADQYVTVTANERYVGDRTPQIEEITVRFSSDPLAAVQALQNGAVQIIQPRVTADVADALASLDVTVLGGNDDAYEHVDIRFAESKNGFVENPLVREAFMKVIPRQEILRELIAPLRPAADMRDSHLFIPGADGYDEAAEHAAPYAEVDIDGARALLAQAGTPAPEICMLFDAGDARRVSEFALMQRSAALAGITMTDCSGPDWRDLLGSPGAYDAALLDSPTSLAVGATSERLRSNGAGNFTFSENAEIDALLNELDGELETSTQLDLRLQIEAHLWKDFSGVPLYQLPALVAFDHRSVQNVSASTLSPAMFWNAWAWSPVLE